MRTEAGANAGCRVATPASHIVLDTIATGPHNPPVLPVHRMRAATSEPAMPYDAIFSPLQMRNLTIKNRILRSNIAGPLRQLRRQRRAGAHQLGIEVRARRRGRDHLVVRAGASARPHPAQLRDDRQRRPDPVLARAWDSRCTSTIANTSSNSATAGGSATSPTIDYPKGLSSTGQDGPDARLRVRADDARADQRSGAGVRRGGAARPRGRPRRRRAARRERLPDHAVPELRDQRPRRRVRRRAGQPRAIRPGDRPGDPGARRARFSPADEDQRDRVQQRADQDGEAGQHG